MSDSNVFGEDCCRDKPNKDGWEGYDKGQVMKTKQKIMWNN